MSSRRKGRHYENQFAQKYGGTRISETGLPGPDVATHHWDTQQGQPLVHIRIISDYLKETLNHPERLHTINWEVKYRDKIATLNWHDQATEEGAFLVMRRAYDTNYYITHPVNQPCPCPLKETTP